jgi:hypothetical protein
LQYDNQDIKIKFKQRIENSFKIKNCSCAFKENIEMSKRKITFVMPFFIFIILLGCYEGKKGNIAQQSANQDWVNEAFDTWQVIGEGTEFLTIKIDLPQKLSTQIKLYALILDEGGYPLRKVSGYTYDPQLEGKNHLWFYFFLYDPRPRSSISNKSKYIKFIYMEEDDAILEKEAEYIKTWGAEEKAKIFDLPAPPDEIDGYIILKDYSFFASDDFREPDGYYVEGKIVGGDGHWSYFVVQSGIKGEKEESEVILPVDRGWIELATGKTHSMPEAVAPSPPYVKGWWDGKGYFHPDPLIVHGLNKLDNKKPVFF